MERYVTGKVKAIGLFSGGLDSIISTKLIERAAGPDGIEIILLHFLSEFAGSAPRAFYRREIIKTAEALGLEVRFLDKTTDMIEALDVPIYGFGKNMNPCIDCRIRMLIKAANFLREVKGNFLFSGEVVGQRPMSQNRKALDIIEEETKIAHLDGRIVRPLSAKLLPETIPEREGWIIRDKLSDISGRSRDVQLDLAERFNIPVFPSPAGGCLLTDPGFSHRVKDVLKYQHSMRTHDVLLMKLGRHFRLSSDAKLIVARNATEEEGLRAVVNYSEGELLLEPTDTPGRPGVLTGSLSGYDERTLRLAAAIILRYGAAKEGAVSAVTVSGKSNKGTAKTEPAPPEICDRYLIALRG